MSDFHSLQNLSDKLDLLLHQYDKLKRENQALRKDNERLGQEVRQWQRRKQTSLDHVGGMIKRLRQLQGEY